MSNLHSSLVFVSNHNKYQYQHMLIEANLMLNNVLTKTDIVLPPQYCPTSCLQRFTPQLQAHDADGLYIF